MRGMAADILVRGLTPNAIAKVAQTIPTFRAGGIGRYPERGHVHLDVRRDGPYRWVG